VQVRRRRLLFLAVALGDKQQDLVFRQRCFDSGQRSWSPYEQGDNYIGENDNIPKRQDRNPVRRRDAFVIALESLSYASFLRLIGEISSSG
jgi:hypothetical protein